MRFLLNMVSDVFMITPVVTEAPGYMGICCSAANTDGLEKTGRRANR